MKQKHFKELISGDVVLVYYGQQSKDYFIVDEWKTTQIVSCLTKKLRLQTFFSNGHNFLFVCNVCDECEDFEECGKERLGNCMRFRITEENNGMKKNDIVKIKQKDRELITRFDVVVEKFKTPRYIFIDRYGKYTFCLKEDIIEVLDTIENFCKECIVKVTCVKEKNIVGCYITRVLEEE